MALTRLSVNGVRNLQPLTLQPSPRINILYGENGSGKTSVLEAIHLLGLARSFRSARLGPVIQYELQNCTVFGQVHREHELPRSLGVSRSRQSDLVIRIDGENVRSAAELAETLPLQLINPDSFSLLEGSPRLRRQYLDWGVFHREPRFLSAWQRAQQALRQRNSWLRRGTLDPALQAAWDHELCQASDEIDQYRQAYIHELKPVFERVLAALLTLDEPLVLSYSRGWDKERSLSEVLQYTLDRDRQLGYTQSGPQRADLRIRVAGHNAADVLSRGQQKLVVCALKIAQGHLVSEQRRSQCVYLIDDLPSELDERHRQALARLLEQLQCQVFVTCVESTVLETGWQAETPVSMFHVEHGVITQTHTSSGAKA